MMPPSLEGVACAGGTRLGRPQALRRTRHGRPSGATPGGPDASAGAPAYRRWTAAASPPRGGTSS
eukprot:7287408-Pyramimonas_sp.AAC.1